MYLTYHPRFILREIKTEVAEVHQDTTQIQQTTIEIRNEASEIRKDTDLIPQILQALQELRSNGRSNIMLERYLDEMTTYAQSAWEGSVIDPAEKIPESPTAVNSTTSGLSTPTRLSLEQNRSGTATPDLVLDATRKSKAIENDLPTQKPGDQSNILSMSEKFESGSQRSVEKLEFVKYKLESNKDLSPDQNVIADNMFSPREASDLRHMRATRSSSDVEARAMSDQLNVNNYSRPVGNLKEASSVDGVNRIPRREYNGNSTKQSAPSGLPIHTRALAKSGPIPARPTPSLQTTHPTLKGTQPSIKSNESSKELISEDGRSNVLSDADEPLTGIWRKRHQQRPYVSGDGLSDLDVIKLLQAGTDVLNIPDSVYKPNHTKIAAAAQVRENLHSDDRRECSKCAAKLVRNAQFERHRSHESLIKFLDEGADVEFIYPKHGKPHTMLLEAVDTGCITCVSILLQYGANPNGWKPSEVPLWQAGDPSEKPFTVSIATRCGSAPMLRLLLRAGADPDHGTAARSPLSEIEDTFRQEAARLSSKTFPVWWIDKLEILKEYGAKFESASRMSVVKEFLRNGFKLCANWTRERAQIFVDHLVWFIENGFTSVSDVIMDTVEIWRLQPSVVVAMEYLARRSTASNVKNEATWDKAIKRLALLGPKFLINLDWLLARGFNASRQTIMEFIAQLSYDSFNPSQAENELTILERLLAHGDEEVQRGFIRAEVRYKGSLLNREKMETLNADVLIAKMRIPKPLTRKHLSYLLSASPATRESWKLPHQTL